MTNDSEISDEDIQAEFNLTIEEEQAIKSYLITRLKQTLKSKIPTN